MRAVALCSARGAPGVTTTALLVASHLDAVMVEADLSGGVVAIRYGLGREPGLVTLAAANPHEPGGWLDHAQNAGGIPVLRALQEGLAGDRGSGSWGFLAVRTGRLSLMSAGCGAARASSTLPRWCWCWPDPMPRSSSPHPTRSQH